MSVAVPALQFLRMRTDVDADLEEMETEASERAAVAAEEVNEAEKFTMMKLLKSAELRMPVIIMVVLQVAQQFSGINAVGRLLSVVTHPLVQTFATVFTYASDLLLLDDYLQVGRRQ